MKFLSCVFACLLLTLAGCGGKKEVHPASTIHPTFTLLAGVVASNNPVNGTGSNARFNVPQGVVVDGAGNAFVADSYNAVIRKISPGGVVSIYAGVPSNAGYQDGALASARFANPCGLALDSAGNLIVADSGNWALRKIGSDGTVSTLAGGPNYYGPMPSPVSVAVGANGTIYVLGQNSFDLYQVSPQGVASLLVPRTNPTTITNGNQATVLLGPNALTVGKDGNLYVVDWATWIKKVTPAGVVSTLAGSANAGSADGTGSAASFKGPSGITVDAAGNLLLTDGPTIRKVTMGGVVTTLAGKPGVEGYQDGTAATATFKNLIGIAADPSGNILVTDGFENTVRMLKPDGSVTTFAGMALEEQRGSTDGLGSAARFYDPRSLAT